MNIIKETLTKQGKTATWLAKKTKIQVTTLYAYAANKYQPTEERLAKIAKELNTKPESLVIETAKIAKELNTKPESNGHVKNCISEVLEKKGYNQAWLIKETGIGSGQISTYVNNHNQPSAENLNKIAKALGRKPSELFQKTEIKVKPQQKKEIQSEQKEEDQDLFQIVKDIPLPGRGKGTYLRLKALKTAEKLLPGEGFNLPVGFDTVISCRNVATYCKKELDKKGIIIKSATQIVNEKPIGVIIKRIK